MLTQSLNAGGKVHVHEDCDRRVYGDGIGHWIDCGRTEYGRRQVEAHADADDARVKPPAFTAWDPSLSSPSSSASQTSKRDNGETEIAAAVGDNLLPDIK
jgi:broad specificity phosphatase PhoE